MSKGSAGPLGIAGALTRAFIASSLTPLFILAALAAGLVALGALPREEEPQISVPMVDIIVQAPGLRAADAEKLITEPLETIVKSINDVEHVYSQSMDNQVMVTARFQVGTSADAACCYFSAKNADILQPAQKVFITWDPEDIEQSALIGQRRTRRARSAMAVHAAPGRGSAATAQRATREPAAGAGGYRPQRAVQAFPRHR